MATKPKKGKLPPKRKNGMRFPPIKDNGPPPTKGDITLQLTCMHTIKTDTRPNPRKPWPDAQMCPECKKKARVIYIHTMGTKKKK